MSLTSMLTRWLRILVLMVLAPFVLLLVIFTLASVKAQTFDDFQLEVIPDQPAAPVGSKNTGGPRDEPVRARDPV